MIERVRRVPRAVLRRASAAFARVLPSVPAPRTMTGKSAFGEAVAAARRDGSTFDAPLLESARCGVAPMTSVTAINATIQRAIALNPFEPTGLTLCDLPRSTVDLYWAG